MPARRVAPLTRAQAQRRPSAAKARTSDCKTQGVEQIRLREYPPVPVRSRTGVDVLPTTRQRCLQASAGALLSLLKRAKFRIRPVASREGIAVLLWEVRVTIRIDS